ncbi:hypothetical protein C4571_03630 [Candidatus Parcubacteria bacterium]|nr:MAG: hypothetical protein C4571_03630 [Candidatus Parcubacteria bacterium]
MDPVRSFFDLPFWTSRPFGVVRTIFIVLDALLLFGFAVAVVKGLHYYPKFDLGGSGHPKKKTVSLRNKFFQERWTGIAKKYLVGSPDSIRVAIIEADALIDEALKQLSFPGEHLADRLEKLNPEDFKTLNRLWNAHRVRNDLVHTPGFTLSAHDAKAVLDNYEAFLKELGML